MTPDEKIAHLALHGYVPLGVFYDDSLRVARKVKDGLYLSFNIDRGWHTGGLVYHPKYYTEVDWVVARELPWDQLNEELLLDFFNALDNQS